MTDKTMNIKDSILELEIVIFTMESHTKYLRSEGEFSKALELERSIDRLKYLVNFHRLALAEMERYDDYLAFATSQNRTDFP